MLLHSIPPVYDDHSNILILGSFPSVRSRETGFFYGHSQNRFWKVLSAIYEVDLPVTIEQKKAFLLDNNIALWDVVASCDIQGSADSTLRHVVANDLSPILSLASLHRIFLNGQTAARYYDRLIKPGINRSAVLLPSTSPANASWSLERLIEAWRMIRQQNSQDE